MLLVAYAVAIGKDRQQIGGVREKWHRASLEQRLLCKGLRGNPVPFFGSGYSCSPKTGQKWIEGLGLFGMASIILRFALEASVFFAEWLKIVYF